MSFNHQLSSPDAHGRRGGRVLADAADRLPAALAATALALALLLFGCGAAPPAAKTVAAHRGTVTFALPPGVYGDYIMPFVGEAANNGNLFDFEPLLYRPLYWFGNHGQFLVNYGQSIGQPPVFSNQGRTVTIRMNHYEWSDGQPVTNRDIQFWMNMLVAEKDNYVGYIPGGIPDDLAGMSFPKATPYQFSLTFTKAFSPTWLLYQQLSNIFPMPQHSWDRTSAGGPVGNYDLTKAGVEKVYSFLNTQAGDVSTYTTNPLWKVVDGPWHISAYSPATGYAAFTPNSAYVGPDRPRIARFVEQPFTSAAAEFDALRAGTIDYGYLPAEDISQKSYFSSRGYQVVPWADWGLNGYYLDYGNHAIGAIFRQLYVRQALAHLIDQRAIVADIYHGYAFPTYGIVPIVPKSPYLSAYQSRSPYPYSIKAARALLRDHGWQVHPDGTDVCIRPGDRARDCGAGVARGARLSFTMLYSSGSASFTAEMEALKSDYSEAGVTLALTSMPGDTIIPKIFTSCASTSAGCSWDMADVGAPGITDTYSPEYLPSGDPFIVPGPSNPSAISNPVISRDIAKLSVHFTMKLFDSYENYVAKDLPMMFMPGYYYQVSVISPHLHGTLPQDPNLNIYPQAWTFS